MHCLKISLHKNRDFPIHQGFPFWYVHTAKHKMILPQQNIYFAAAFIFKEK